MLKIRTAYKDRKKEIIFNDSISNETYQGNEKKKRRKFI